MDTYCWIHSTFTLPKWTSGAPHPGVSHLTGANDEVTFHKYYQWVCFVLFFQAAIFCIPEYLWKSSEDNKIKMLVQDLHVSSSRRW